MPLAPIRAVDLAPAAILQALDLPSGASSEPQHRLCHHLRDRQLLLVLDGFEHLLTDGREEPTGLGWLSALLTSAPDLKLLITSRERLALHDEWLLPLGGFVAAASRSARIAPGGGIWRLARRAPFDLNVMPPLSSSCTAPNGAARLSDPMLSWPAL